MAEGLLRARFADAGLAIRVDSAGTGSWHIGNPPDPRTVEAARRNGIGIGSLKARQLVEEDFHRFDLILAMDARNVADALSLKPAGSRAEVHRFLDYAGAPADVPDPYYGNAAGFQSLFDMLDQATGRLVLRLQAASG